MASMRDIKRKKKQHTEYSADHKGHEARFIPSSCKRREHMRKATDPYFNYMYRTVSSMLAQERQYGAPILKGRRFAKEGGSCY